MVEEVRQFYQTDYQNQGEFLGRYFKSERPLMERFLDLTQLLKEEYIPYLWIGSGPIPALANREYRRKLSSSDDIDIITLFHPSNMTYAVEKVWNNRGKLELVEDRLVNRIRPHPVNGHVIEWKDSTVYHFKYFDPTTGKEAYLPLCVFYGKVDVVHVHRHDFKNPVVINTGDQNLTLPSLGLFLATRLHPQTLTDKRSYKTGLVVESMESDDEIGEVARESKARFVEALQTYPTRLSREDFKKAKNRLIGLSRKKLLQRFQRYVEEAFNL